MALYREIDSFLAWYPQIYFACHRRHVHDEKTGKTLSLKQASILDHLHHTEPIHLHSLAKHMRVTPSTMSLAVDRLEQAGFLVRVRDRRDARRIELRLTAAGNRLKQQQKLLDPELVGELLKRLKGRARAQALHGLELLAGAATETIASRRMDLRGARLKHRNAKGNRL
jgi:DNA-binding MarR family transcriptional regulator